jgi:hypothetical protein
VELRTLDTGVTDEFLLLAVGRRAGGVLDGSSEPDPDEPQNFK